MKLHVIMGNVMIGKLRNYISKRILEVCKVCTQRGFIRKHAIVPKTNMCGSH